VLCLLFFPDIIFISSSLIVPTLSSLFISSVSGQSFCSVALSFLISLTNSVLSYFSCFVFPHYVYYPFFASLPSFFPYFAFFSLYPFSICSHYLPGPLRFAIPLSFPSGNIPSLSSLSCHACTSIGSVYCSFWFFPLFCIAERCSFPVQHSSAFPFSSDVFGLILIPSLFSFSFLRVLSLFRPPCYPWPS